MTRSRPIDRTLTAPPYVVVNHASCRMAFVIRGGGGGDGGGAGSDGEASAAVAVGPGASLCWEGGWEFLPFDLGGDHAAAQCTE